MARIKKPTLPEQGFAHREHRSKKGRRSNPEKVITLDKKKKLEEVKIKELYEFFIEE